MAKITIQYVDGVSRLMASCEYDDYARMWFGLMYDQTMVESMFTAIEIALKTNEIPGFEQQFVKFISRLRE